MPNHLLALRLHHGYSQQQLADALGVTKLTVGRWERGEMLPRPFYLERLCQVFGCQKHDLGFSSPPAALALPAVSQEGAAPAALYDAAIPAAPPVPLVGREEVLARIKAQLCQPQRRVVFTALNGLPGVGKTSLAITLAHDPALRASFPDGILWASLGPQPPLLTLLSRWGVFLGLSELQLAASDEAQKRQALQAVLRRRAMLLVLDDVWRLEDALALRLGGPQCAYLLTTRFPTLAAQLAVGGAMRIEELAEEQSLDLLQQLAPSVVEREGEKTRQLIRAVGGLPLALTLVGHYLRKHAYQGPTRRITAALERLRQSEARVQLSEPQLSSEAHPSLPQDAAISLEAVIAVSDQLLTPAARSTLYALSVFPAKPHSFAEEAALAVAACTTGELDELLDAGLLEYQGGERYRLHHSIADYAGLHLSNEQVVTGRLLGYLQQYVERHATAYEVLEEESALLLAALERSVTGEAWQAHVVPLVCAAAPFLLLRGYYQDTQRFLEHAHDLAAASQQHEELAAVLLLLGDVHDKRGDLRGAREQYRRGKALAQELQDTALLGRALGNIGRITSKLGEYEEAERVLQEGLTLARATGQADLVGDLCVDLAALFYLTNEVQQAEAYAREGLAMARQRADRRQIVALSINLGIILAQQLSAEAPAWYEEALRLAQEIGDEDRCCLIWNNLGDWYLNIGEYVRAESCLGEALAIARRLGARERIGIALTTLILLLVHQGRLEEAERCAQEALALVHELGSPRLTASVLNGVGNLALARGHGELALEVYEQMEQVSPQGSVEQQALSRFGLARSYEQLGRWEQASAFGRQALALLQQHTLMQHVRRVEAWYTRLRQRLSER